MLKMLRTTGRILISACWWAVVFAVCRAAVWRWEYPAWWTLPAGLAVGLSWVCLTALYGRARRDPGGDERLAPADPRLEARMLRAWRSGRALWRRSRPDLLGRGGRRPWHICLSLGGNGDDDPLACDGLSFAETAGGGELSWRLGEAALWLGVSTGEDGERIRPAFGRVFGRERGDAVPRAVAAVLDAERLLNAGPAALRDDARLLRDMLGDMRRETGVAVAVHLIVNRLDRLYGLRSLVPLLDPARLPAPLGSPLGGNGPASRAEIDRILADAAGSLVAGMAPGRPPVTALQAGPEILRLGKPLAAFCGLAFEGGAGPHGIYLGSAGAAGRTLPSSLSGLSGFRECPEPLPDGASWFLHDLVEHGLPAARADATGTAAVPTGFGRLRPAFAALTASALIACSLLTWTFLDSRTILLSAAGRAKAPESAEALADYLLLADDPGMNGAGWHPPRFGMNEAGDLAAELRRRYVESYFDLKAVPGMEALQDRALAAAGSRDPEEIGDALLLLAAMRGGISRSLEEPDRNADGAKLLNALLVARHLASPGEVRQLETFFAWAGKQDWMPEARDALAEFEGHVLERAEAEGIDWLPGWIGSLPGLEPADASRVWEPVALSRDERQTLLVDAAWTAEGYRIASGFLDAVAGGSGDDARWRRKRGELLAAYRRSALGKWRETAERLWVVRRGAFPDGDVRALVRNACRRQDPASRFTALLRANLLPMFAGDDDEPDIVWLRLLDRLEKIPSPGGPRESGASPELAARFAGLVRDMASDDGMTALAHEFGLGSGGRRYGVLECWLEMRDALRMAGLAAETPGDNLEAVRRHFLGWNDPGADPVAAGDAYAAVERTSRYLHDRLREMAGSAAWDGVSPLASYRHFRRLAVRQAALQLDARWRAEVYGPALLEPGDGNAKLRAAQLLTSAFLSTHGRGFWRHANGRIVNAEWDGVAFAFSSEFLAGCSEAAQNRIAVLPNQYELPLRIDALNVDSSARERPERLEIVVESAGGLSKPGTREPEKTTQRITFRNYRTATALRWTRGERTKVALRVVFPSVTAEMHFPGPDGLRKLAALFSGGEFVLAPGDFPAAATALRGLGIRGIVVRGELERAEELVGTWNAPEPLPPDSIIVRDAGERREAGDTTEPAAAPYRLAAWRSGDDGRQSAAPAGRTPPVGAMTGGF